MSVPGPDDAPGEPGRTGTGSSGDSHIDPTLVRNQPALTRSSGRSWLIVGALLAAVTIGVLIPLLPQARVLASVAIVAIVVDYLVMVGVQLLLTGVRRLIGHAIALALMAALGLLAVILIAVAAVSI